MSYKQDFEDIYNLLVHDRPYNSFEVSKKRLNVEKAFERLEELEKENEELKEEYEKLDRNFHSCHLDYEELEAENQKRKKVLDILKDHFDFKLGKLYSTGEYYLMYDNRQSCLGHTVKILTKEEYYLIEGAMFNG